MLQLELGHVVLWLPCFVQVGVALSFTATPNTIIVAFLWYSITRSDVVFEVEAYKYKAVAQLIKHYLRIAEFTVLWSLGECSNLQPLTRVSALFHRLSITFHDQKLRNNKNLCGRWEMWVYQGTKPWLFSLIASKSSQVISFRDGFPRDYSDNAVLKLADN